MDNLKLRSATYSDARFVQDIERECFGRALGSRNYIKRYLKLGGRIGLAFHEQRPVGMAIYDTEPEHPNVIIIRELIVVPSYRRNGIGSIMLDMMKKVGISYDFAVAVEESNLPAQLFLKGHGFKAVCIAKDAAKIKPDHYIFRYFADQAISNNEEALYHFSDN